MNSFYWYSNRLRMMGARELIGMRLYRALRDSLPFTGLKAPDTIVLTIHPLDGSYREFYLQHFGHLKDEILADADRVMENRLSIFGNEICFGETIDWNQDFVTGNCWPTSEQNYRTSSIGDPKYVWELNRQQFLPLLGKAYFLSGDEKYATKAISTIISWIEQNPPFCGINWQSGIELALRQLSWFWTLRLLGGSGRLSAEDAKLIGASFYLQTAHIARNLSFYSSANNHLISELMAMSVIGEIVGEKTWCDTSAGYFNQEIDKQILPDGVGAEQSPAYQAHTSEYYLLHALALMKQGLAVPDVIKKGLDRGACFLGTILDKDGMPALLCDSDSGDVLLLSSRYSTYKSILNLTAHITGNYSHLQHDIERDEKTFWLTGLENFHFLIEQTKGIPPHSPQKGFETGGYYTLENTLNGKNVRIVFDCGPLGMQPMAGHGHADALHFILYLNDHPVFIDPGTFTYFGSDFWRDYFRGTSAHNTVRIDGMNQSRFGGKFLSLFQAKTECTGWLEGERVSGVHNGYRCLPDPVTHARTLFLDSEKSLLRIEDLFTTQGDHLIEIFFHLDPSCRILSQESHEFRLVTQAGELTLSLDRDLKSQLYYGDTALPLGWHSHQYGNKEKTFTLVGRTLMRGGGDIITEIGF